MKKHFDLLGMENARAAMKAFDESGAEFLREDGLSVETSVAKTENGYCIKRVVKNVSGKTLKLKELLLSVTGMVLGGNACDDYYYCNENARLFCHLTIPLDYNRFDDGAAQNAKFGLSVNRKWIDAEVQLGRICSSPYQPFPAILISNYKSKNGIVCGSLSQDVFYHSFEVGHQDNTAYLKIYSSFKDIAYREIAAEEELTDILYLGETERADDINVIFDGYTSELRKYINKNRGGGTTNRHSLIWDSWNDGIYRNVSEEMLIREAKAVKRLFPVVEWFQLDDGYSKYCHENVDLDAHGLGVAYEGEAGVDKEKFPDGLKGYTNKIREIGLKPAIWIGGLCPVKTMIYREHPEWFIDYTYRIDWTQPLDVSKKEVREYMCFALDTLICEYGFEGVKHDFWSYAFEDRHDLLQNKDKAGYEYREWWHKQLRDRVGESGYLETGCDVSMGNPFIGKYFNNYRFGLDVGAGKWENVKTTVFWGVAALSTHTGDLFIPNSDSVGLLPALNDVDYMFVVNWQIITRSLVEISGRFSQIDETNPRLRMLKRAVSYLNNGENVYFAKYDYRKKGIVLPEIIYIDSAFDADDFDWITVAVFNGGETEKEISFAYQDVGLSDGEHCVKYVWENRTEKASSFDFYLKPHQSVLMKIKK